MTANITIGQYFPAKSPVHSLDSRVKLILTLLLIVLIFLADNYISMLLIVLITLFLVLISRIPIRMIAKSCKVILPIIIFTTILNLFYSGGDTVLVKFWIITVYREGIQLTLFIVIRLLCLIITSSLLTYTTSPIALTDGLERLMSPLKLVRVPVHELSMMMTIALRFIPTLVEETNKIMNAQKARGADIDTGGLIKRVKALVPILIPLFVSAIRRAEELALAMECRCYRGGEGRTRMKVLRLGIGELFAAMVVGLFYLAVITANLYMK